MLPEKVDEGVSIIFDDVLTKGQDKSLIFTWEVDIEKLLIFICCSLILKYQKECILRLDCQIVIIRECIAERMSTSI